MMHIDPSFRKLFLELEQGHITLREKLNQLPERGKDLEAVLGEEIERFESWRFPLMGRIGQITADFSEGQQKDHQLFIRNTRYYRIVQEAPFYRRIINKPNGYAGDAYLMKCIYEDQFAGDTPFGMFLNKHALSTKICHAIRQRKAFLTRQIFRRDEGRILSLAAGPAQEIKEIMDTSQGKKYQFMALDHDMEVLINFPYSATPPHEFRYALANAFHFISGKHLTARPRSAVLKYCYPRKDSRGLSRLLSKIKYELDPLQYDTFDMIYSASLYDYILTFPLDDGKGAISLTKNLFDLVKPGGCLVVGNFSKEIPEDLRFAMDYIYDWKLIYRDKQDLIDCTRAIPAQHIKDFQVIEEPLGINYFLKIEKR